MHISPPSCHGIMRRVDTLSFLWTGLSMSPFPLFSLIHMVLCHTYRTVVPIAAAAPVRPALFVSAGSRPTHTAERHAASPGSDLSSASCVASVRTSFQIVPPRLKLMIHVWTAATHGHLNTLLVELSATDLAPLLLFWEGKQKYRWQLSLG